MSFRDWLYVTITNFGQWAAGISDDVITSIWYRASDLYWGLENERDSVKAGVSWCFSWIPDLLGFARNWLTYLITGYIVDPVFNLLKWPFGFVMDKINALWWSAYGHYIPVENALESFLHIRDRLINLIDFVNNLVSGLQSYLIGLLNSAYNTLMGFVNAAIAGLNDWASWVTQTVWTKVLELWVSVDNTNRALTQIYNDFEVIRRDPAGWLWSNLEPVLQRNVEDWLNSIWYA